MWKMSETHAFSAFVIFASVITALASVAISNSTELTEFERRRLFFILLIICLGSIAFFYRFIQKQVEQRKASEKLMIPQVFATERERKAAEALQGDKFEEEVSGLSQGEKESFADEFASGMKDLYEALMSVGFTAEQAITLMETSTEDLDEYDTIREFADDLWKIFNSLKEKGFAEEQALRLIPYYWRN